MFKLSSAFELSMVFVVLVLCLLTTNICQGTDGLDDSADDSLSRYIKSSNSELEEVKPRRGGTVGLFAFPRVGRSDPSLLNWEASPNSYEEYDDLSKVEIKRQGLVPFPRVGRSDANQLRKWSKLALQQSLDKRSGASANSGLWFGPRLGRIQKRSAGGMPAVDDNRLDVYTPRLGRESDETVNPDYDYDVILTNLADLKNLKKPINS